MKRHNWFELLLLSEGLAFAFAITFVITLTLSLPPTDGAYGQVPFADPLVAPVMSMVAGTAGLLAAPLVYLTLRRRRIRSCLPVILGVTLGWIVLMTPLKSGAGLLGSFPAFGASLLLCCRLVPVCHPPGHCRRCGYDLTGNVSGRCPECGTRVLSSSPKAGRD